MDIQPGDLVRLSKHPHATVWRVTKISEELEEAFLIDAEGGGGVCGWVSAKGLLLVGRPATAVQNLTINNSTGE